MSNHIIKAREELHQITLQALARLQETPQFKEYQETKSRLATFDATFSQDLGLPSKPQDQVVVPTAPAHVAAAPKKMGRPSNAEKAAKATGKTTDATSKKDATSKRDVRHDTDGRQISFKEAIVKVMGTANMTSHNIHEGLRARGWAPTNSTPLQYISFMLSNNTDTFHRVERGVYQVISSPKAKTPKATTATTAAPTKVNEELASLGLAPGKSAPDPFDDVATT